MPTTAQTAAVAAAIFVVFTALEFNSSEDEADLLNLLLFPALGLVYVPLSALVARNARGRMRAAWWVMTIGLVCWAVGELLFSYYGFTNGETPFPSWADAAYLMYVPFVAMALLLFPSLRSWRDQGRVFLDGLIVTGSFVLISWLEVMRTIWFDGPEDRLDFLVSLAYPVGDVLVLTLGFLVLLRAPSGLRLTFTLLVAGLACAALADSGWAYLTQRDADPTLEWLPEVLYVANALLIIVALVAAYHAETGGTPSEPSRGLLAQWLPFVPLMGAAVAVAASPQDVVREAPVVITGVVLITATLIRQFIESAELLHRETENRRLTDRLTEELDGASQYVASILPGPLAGPVQVTSRYLPARAVGGDSFDYQWIDDDHLMVYLVEVSGRGVKPALLSVAVHNLLRYRGVPPETLLAPDLVFDDLNSRFSMDELGDHYFTMWYGVYRLSTGVLRYANAGHPPPLVLTVEDGSVRSVPLNSASVPLGLFPDSRFTAQSYAVPAGARILLYSDGVLGDPPDMADFVALCTDMAGDRSFWLDDLVDEVPNSEDDSSVVLLTFSAAAGTARAAAVAASAGAVSSGLPS